MPPAPNISWGQDDSRRGSSEERDNPSPSFKLAEVHLTPSGLWLLSRATPTSYNIDTTWAVEISPKAGAHRHSMEGKRGNWRQRWGRVEETPLISATVSEIKAGIWGKMNPKSHFLSIWKNFKRFFPPLLKAETATKGVGGRLAVVCDWSDKG